MRIGKNPKGIAVYAALRMASNQLYTSMRKLSSGDQISRPGDAPSELGISEQLRFQIRNSGEAKRNMENAKNLINSADSWLQVTQQILTRMSELAISSNDSSKSAGDRAALQEEFSQLKQEVQRIGRQAQYNGIQVAGRDQLLSYDQDSESFFFSELDGNEKYHLNVKVISGVSSQNNLDFLFDPTKDYTLSGDGQYIFYVDRNDNLNRYDIEKGVIARDTSDSNDKSLEVDNEGRLWYASENPPASGVYALRQQSISTWTQDTTFIGSTDVTDMGSKEFKIYENRIYYYNTTGDYVSRSLQNLSDVKTQLSSSDLTLNTTDGQFAISEDGQFVTDLVAPGMIRVTNADTKQSNTLNVGPTVGVDDLTFSVDTTELAYIDTTDGSIHRVDLKIGDYPEFGQDVLLHKSESVGFSGLSLDGGSNRTRFRLQYGPDAGQESFLTAGDVRLNTLGLSRVSVETAAEAQHALGQLQKAIDIVGVQRSHLGVASSRLDTTMDALTRYVDNVSMADSTIRDVDVAQESARVAELQVRQQAAMALLAQANSQASTVLQLLNR